MQDHAASTEIVPRTTVVEIASYRDQALSKIKEAADLLRQGHEMAREALKLAERAHGASHYRRTDSTEMAHYRNLFVGLEADASIEAFRKQLDSNVWTHLMLLSGMRTLMDRTAKEQLDADLRGDVPAFSIEAAHQVFEALRGDATLIFQRGLARAFSELDRRFRSHDGFKLGARIILTRVFDDHGYFNYHSRMFDVLADVERVFAVLDGKKPDPDSLRKGIEADRGGRWGAKQSLTETPYFRVRCFQNGNAHLWFKRDDLVTKANQVLAAYYGEVLPDAAHPDTSPDDLRSVAGLPARDLSFYPTPEAVVDECLRSVNVRKGARALEPSAGTGNMVRKLLDLGARVDAMEIHPDRAQTLKGIRHPRLIVHEANFLGVAASPVYDIVLMNPPFYGTHWMEHIMHAFDFLITGGSLVAVLPISAVTGESKKHEAFRAWAEKHHRGWGNALFTDLPLESFAASGTRINTVILTLTK